jgi:hypothetical protein
LQGVCARCHSHKTAVFDSAFCSSARQDRRKDLLANERAFDDAAKLKESGRARNLGGPFDYYQAVTIAPPMQDAQAVASPEIRTVTSLEPPWESHGLLHLVE